MRLDSNSEEIVKEFVVQAKARDNFKAKTFFLPSTMWEYSILPPFALCLNRKDVARGYKAAHEVAFKKYPHACEIIFLRTKYFLERL